MKPLQVELRLVHAFFRVFLYLNLLIIQYVVFKFISVFRDKGVQIHSYSRNYFRNRVKLSIATLINFQFIILKKR